MQWISDVGLKCNTWKMLTWHGDVAQRSDMAQGQQSLGDIFYIVPCG